MDIQLKRIQELRRNDCKKVIGYVNSVNFASLDDKQIRTLLMIRELGCGIVNRNKKLGTDDDVSRTLKNSIESMEMACRRVVDEISTMSFHELSEQERTTLQIILEIAQGIIGKDDATLNSLLVVFNQALVGEEVLLIEGGTMEIDSGDMAAAEQMHLQDGHIDMDINADEEALAIVEHIDLQDGRIDMDISEHVQETISWPLNEEINEDWIINLMEMFNFFSQKKSLSEFSLVMPLAIVELLMSKALDILHQEPNCVQVECDNDAKVVVVGDLHGQYLDLLTIWKSAGLPSEKQFFVFNGNYVDKGPSSLELFLILLAWKVFLPHRVFLLRGSHESSDISKICGFLEEINLKFPEQGDTVFQRCLEVFAELPLASVIANCVYTTHGGLFRSEEIGTAESSEETEVPNTIENNSERKRQKIATTPSLGSLDELARVNRFVQDLPAKDSILTDILYSDPKMEPGLTENDRGEGGLLWGPDCTETFLKLSNLKVIIRSHEGPDARYGREGMKNMLDGYSMDHEVETGKLYTLFSAPDCPQHTGKEYKNKGAYAVLKPPQFDSPEFVLFEASKHLERSPAWTKSTRQFCSADEHAQEATISHQQAYAQQLPSESTQQYFAAAQSDRADFEAVAASTSPPPWIKSLADDADGTRPVKLSEASKVEGSPVPRDLAHPILTNYEYLINVIGSLKKELKEKDEVLESYKLRYESPGPSAG